MGRLPDLSGLIYFATFGMFCAGLLVVFGGGWLLYHLGFALMLYWGIL